MIKKSKQHLRSVNENYFEHMLIELKVSSNMFYGSLLALIHGLIPVYFKLAQVAKLKNFMNLSIKRDNNNNKDLV
ncbi:DUF6356 family protein [Candidatus Pelagibacter sp.]|nr:DUF6356 family protein [Candidatus Pelagibacter sp.]